MFTSRNSGHEFSLNSSGMACFFASSYSLRRFVFAAVQRTPQRLHHVFGIPARVVLYHVVMAPSHIKPLPATFCFQASAIDFFFIFQRIDTSIHFNAALDNHFSYAAELYTKYVSLRHSKRDPISRHVTFRIKTGAVTPTNVTSSYVKSCFALNIARRNVTSSHYTTSYAMSPCVLKGDCL